MVRQRSGQLVLGLAAVAVVLLGGGLFASQLFGSIESFITFLTTNYYPIIGFLLAVGAVVLVVVNSNQENPKWRRDIAGLLFVVFLIGVLVPVGSSLLSTYSTTVSVHTDWGVVGNPSISGMEVAEPERSSPFSVVGVPGTSGVFGLFTSDATVQLSVTCDGSELYRGSEGVTVSIFGSTSAQFTVNNLEPGMSCSADADLLFDTGSGEEVVDSRTRVFTVPG